VANYGGGSSGSASLSREPREAWLQDIIKSGGVGERLKPAVLKTVGLERASGVRIPPPPPWLMNVQRTWLLRRLGRRPSPEKCEAKSRAGTRPNLPGIRSTERQTQQPCVRANAGSQWSRGYRQCQQNRSFRLRWQQRQGCVGERELLMPRFLLVQYRFIALAAAQNKKSSSAAAAIFPHQAERPAYGVEEPVPVLFRATLPVFFCGRKR
jgi:hypothetical protein